MKLVPKSITRKLAMQALKNQKNAPKILFFAGLAGTTASTVLACRSTLKLEETVIKTQADLARVRDAVEAQNPEYTQDDFRKDTAIIYVRGVVAVGRLYAPAILMGAASVACLTKSHNILENRLLASTAAYTALDEAFKSYRANVVEKYGADVDREMRYEHEEYEEIGERGGVTTKKRVNIDKQPSMYSRFFDEYSDSWSENSEYNFTFLLAQQNWFNQLLQHQGFIMLNDVYKALGLTQTSPGAVVGWILDGEGDSHIDFGLFDESREGVIDFVNGRQNAILLDFNVDGMIYDKLDKLGMEKIHAWQK